MFEKQQVIDRLRLFLRKDDQQLSDELANDATHYYDMCKQANQRLRICAEYLRLGLRTEAIQLCEEEPYLLDMVAALDFPELHDWVELTITYQLPHEPLLLEFVDSLNESYMEQEPVESLITHFRFMALLGTPLRKRLQHLRTIAAEDSESAYWDDDVREFEKARFREIIEEAREASQNQNLKALASLLNELNYDDWLEHPPHDLIQKIGSVHEALLARHPSRSQWRQELEQHEKRLRAALKAGNLEAAFAAARKWYAMVKQLALAKHSPECTRVIPILKGMRQMINGFEDQIDM